MEKQVYITEEERTKCQKVVDAFAELYEMGNIDHLGKMIRYYIYTDISGKELIACE